MSLVDSLQVSHKYVIYDAGLQLPDVGETRSLRPAIIPAYANFSNRYELNRMEERYVCQTFALSFETKLVKETDWRPKLF